MHVRTATITLWLQYFTQRTQVNLQPCLLGMGLVAPNVHRTWQLAQSPPFRPALSLGQACWGRPWTGCETRAECCVFLNWSGRRGCLGNKTKNVIQLLRENDLARRKSSVKAEWGGVSSVVECSPLNWKVGCSTHSHWVNCRSTLWARASTLTGRTKSIIQASTCCQLSSSKIIFEKKQSGLSHSFLQFHSILCLKRRPGSGATPNGHENHANYPTHGVWLDRHEKARNKLWTAPWITWH